MKKFFLFILISLLCVSVCSKDTNSPLLELESPKVEIETGASFDPLKVAKAQDDIDGDITDKIIVKSNNVNSNIEGTYTVVYEVRDNANNAVQATITVVVKESLTPIELDAIKVINALRGILKNPDSLQVHSIQAKRYMDYERVYHFKLDCSAQNGFGGLNRKTYYITSPDDIDKEVSAMVFHDTIQGLSMKNYENNSFVLKEDINVDKILNNLDKTK